MKKTKKKTVEPKQIEPDKAPALEPALIKWGLHLKACRLIDPATPPRIVAVIDLGSNSLKLAIFDISQKFLIPIHDDDEIVHLAKGMVPHDRAPKLNKDGVDKMLDKVLPRFRKHMEHHKVDTIIVLETEAMRSAARYDPEAVEKINKKIAGILGIPMGAINILSKDKEAELAAKAVAIQNAPDTFSVTLGGGSTEIAINPKGIVSKEHRKTLRFGTQSLLALKPEKAADIIRRGFEKNHAWFHPHSPKPDRLTGIKPVTSVVFQGGAFRPLGRRAAMTLYNVPFYAELPRGGWRFAWDEPFRAHLEALKGMTKTDLKNELIRWGQPHLRDAPESKLEKWKKSKACTNWLRSPIQEMGSLKLSHISIAQKWEKRILRRIDTFAIAIEVINAAAECVRPDEACFGGCSIREAAALECRLH